MVVSLDVERSLEKCMVRMMDLTDGKFGSSIKILPAMQEPQETKFPSQDREDPLEKEMETHCSILAWRIPSTEETGGLQSMWSQRVGHN